MMICYRKLAVIFAVTRQISIRRSATFVAVNRYANHAGVAFETPLPCPNIARIIRNVHALAPFTAVISYVTRMQV